ncbi:esterase-like activity of phytase family protein [Actibacterium lipolyticum]|uniref:Phytase-like domain-containing protein n=1 Tax=Actibacterium lipolyticum TaxID=1524263 RepID=A0A238KUG8_9RHOB|nr:esterase-like activity of phytase family protein [Actibacterium lipolyticum]SMX46504.1 hypothetical protein COL8621_03139 [Actibacterium lipolyticum]
MIGLHRHVKRAVLALALLSGLAWHPPAAYAESGYAVDKPRFFEWHVDHDEFGGFSGILVEDGGRALSALSDHGTLFTGVIERSGREITGISEATAHALNDPGKPFTPFQRDAEGLARAPKGELIVVFESYTRVKKYTQLGRRARSLHHWEAFKELFGNESFESGSYLPDGRLVVFVEGSGEGETTDAYTYDDIFWDGPYKFPTSDGFAISGADLGPDGRLYILDRKFSITKGFTSRIRSFALDAEEMTERTLFEGKLGNAEGIAVWENDEGEATITLITDNGFGKREKTYLIEFDLHDGKSWQERTLANPFPARGIPIQ